jgi:hypothetical protein
MQWFDKLTTSVGDVGRLTLVRKNIVGQASAFTPTPTGQLNPVPPSPQ